VEDEAVRRQSVEAFNAEIEALLVFYAPDVVCHPARGWVGETVCHGHEGIRRLSAVWSEHVVDAALQVHDVRDLHERIVVLAELTGRTRDSGVQIRQPFGVVNSDLREDGKVGEVRFFLSWGEALRCVGLED
jgi:SnoaL-like domain